MEIKDNQMYPMKEENMSDKAKRLGCMVVAIGCVTLLSGCEWWPPALQERIAQQEEQVQNLEGEKIALQKKVTQATKTVGECNAQVAQATQTQTDLQAQVDQLKTSLEEAEEKLVKKGKPAKK